MSTNTEEPRTPVVADRAPALRMRFAIGTCLTAVLFSAAVVGWWHIPESESGEGLAFVLFGFIAGALVVSVWAGIHGWLGLRFGYLLVRWAFVALAAAVTVEVASIADCTVTGGAGRVLEDLLLLIPTTLLLVLMAAAFGGAIGLGVRELVASSQRR